MDADQFSESASAGDETAPAEDDSLLDPATTERKFYRVDGLSREIWRPGEPMRDMLCDWTYRANVCTGDGDGDQTTDYFDRVGPSLPLEQRWRLFQVSHTILLSLASTACGEHWQPSLGAQPLLGP